MADPILIALQMLLKMAHPDERLPVEWMIQQRLKELAKDCK